jgi:hypothetical protein
LSICFALQLLRFGLETHCCDSCFHNFVSKMVFCIFLFNW